MNDKHKHRTCDECRFFDLWSGECAKGYEGLKLAAEDACKKFKLADDIKKMEKEHEL